MSYRCQKPQCGREVHRNDYHPNLRCYCGAPVHLDVQVKIAVLVDGKVRDVERFELPHMIRVGRGSSLSLRRPDLNLTPYLNGKKSVSRNHLTLYVTEDRRVRVSLDSEKQSMVVNRITMRPGCPAEELDLPVDLKLSSSLALRVEMS